MERHDEMQIMESLAGRFSRKFIYDIPFRDRRSEHWQCELKERCALYRSKEPHKHVRGLSWTGVKEGVRLWGHVKIQVTRPELATWKNKEYFVCSAVAIDTLRDVTFEGISKRVALKRTITSRDGRQFDEEDPFAYEKAQSLAMRNGAQNLLPQPLVKAWFEDFVAGKEGLSIKHVVNVAREAGVVNRTAPTRTGTPTEPPPEPQEEAPAPPPEAPKPPAVQVKPAAPAAPPAPAAPKKPPAQGLPAPNPPAPPQKQPKPPAQQTPKPPAQQTPKPPAQQTPKPPTQQKPQPPQPAPAPQTAQEAADAAADQAIQSVEEEMF